MIKKLITVLVWMLPALALGQAQPNGNAYIPPIPTAVSSPTNGQCLVYQSSTSNWVNGACASGAGTPGGSNTQVQYNNSNSLGGTSTLTWTAAGGLVDSLSPAASNSAFKMSGAPFTGGSGTTTFPLFYLNDGTAPTTFSASGTEIGINAPSGFAGNIFDYHLNGSASEVTINAQNGIVINEANNANATANGQYQLEFKNTTENAVQPPQIYGDNLLAIGNFGGTNAPAAPSGANQCNANGSGAGTDFYFTTMLSFLGNGQTQLCFSDLTSYFIVWDNNVSSGANFFLPTFCGANTLGDAACLETEQSTSTTCADGISSTPVAYNGPCWIFETSTSPYATASSGGGGAGTVPLSRASIVYPYIISDGFAWEGFFYSNAVWFGIGDTTPVKFLNATSTGTNNATVTLGDTHATSVTKAMPLQAIGTTFTVSGCGTAASITGGSDAGTFSCGTGASPVTLVFTINGATGQTATHGWICVGSDQTSGIMLPQTASSTTTCTLKGNVATNDVVGWAVVKGY